jgi:hypothetical protein
MANIYDLSDTWNAGATVFTAIKMNVTDTASAAGSLLMDLQVGGVSRFSVGKGGQLAVVNGTAAAPSISFADETNTGMFRAVTNQIGYTIGGVIKARLGSADLSVVANHFIGWSVDAGGFGTAIDTRLYRDAANTLAQRNGVNAQAFNLYNTYTDASNYERGFMRWVSSNLEIGAEGAGTGNANRKTRILASGGVVAEFENGYVGLYQSGVRNILINASSSSQIGLANGSIGIGANVLTIDAKIIRSAAGVLGIRGASTDGGSVELIEQTAPAAPATNGVRIYAEDDGAGKTRLMARFATGAAVQIAIEP